MAVCAIVSQCIDRGADNTRGCTCGCGYCVNSAGGGTSYDLLQEIKMTTKSNGITTCESAGLYFLISSELEYKYMFYFPVSDLNRRKRYKICVTTAVSVDSWERNYNCDR